MAERLAAFYSFAIGATKKLEPLTLIAKGFWGHSDRALELTREGALIAKATGQRNFAERGLGLHQLVTSRLDT